MLLDCRKNRYFGVAASDSCMLAAHIEDWPWPVKRIHSEDSKSDPQVQNLIHDMLQRGVLVRKAFSGSPKLRVVPAPPTLELCSVYSEQKPCLTAYDIRAFLWSQFIASYLLRWRSLEYILDRIRKRRARFDNLDSRTSRQFDANSTRILVEKYNVASRAMYSKHDICLYEAVALSEFLSKYEVFPYCVIGVTAKPFSAHCWLQQDHVLVNDKRIRVQNFTPMLAA